MKLGRACAAGAVLCAVVLPFTAGTAAADEPSTPATTTPSEPPTSTAPTEPPTSTEPPAPTEPPRSTERPRPDAPTERERLERLRDAMGRSQDAPPGAAQVRQRPVGAPETGGGPEEQGLDPAVAGGAAAFVTVAAGGVVLARRRRRTGAH